MKAFLLFILLIFFLGCVKSPQTRIKIVGNSLKSKLTTAGTDVSKNLMIRKLSNETYLVKDVSFYDSNVLVTKISKTRVLVISSFIDTVKTLELMKWIELNLKPEKIEVLNTHFHADGTGGNEGYKLKGAQIWSSELTHALYTKRAKSMQIGLVDAIENKKQKEDLLKRKNIFADKLFKIDQPPVFGFGKARVEVYFPGPAHSPDNLVVYLPKQKILFGGCMLRALSWDSLGNTHDADLKQYYNSVRSLLKFKSKVVVPGHGNIGGMELIRHTMSLAAEYKN